MYFMHFKKPKIHTTRTTRINNKCDLTFRTLPCSLYRQVYTQDQWLHTQQPTDRDRIILELVCILCDQTVCRTFRVGHW